MFPKKTLNLAQSVIDILSAQNKMIVTAESCTGGLIAGALTAVPGSSAVVYGGFVTYANEAKMGMIDVPDAAIQEHGAVSKQVALDMANGARNASGADLSIAVTGVAGPGGGTKEKPVGLVHIACSSNAKTGFDIQHIEKRFGNIGREAVRLATIDAALELVLDVVGHPA